MTFFFTIKCNLGKQLDMTKVTTLRHTKGKVPSNIFTKLGKKKKKNIANFVFFYLCCCVQHFYHLSLLACFSKLIGGHPPLHHSCCSGSWIDPAVPNVSRFTILKVQIRSQYHRLLHGNFRIVGLQGQNLNGMKQKKVRNIPVLEICQKVRE